MIVELPLLVRPGLYVVQFPLHVKIAACTSGNLMSRLATHGAEGGTRAWVSPPVSDAEAAEKVALRMAIERSGVFYVRGRMPERFPDLTFGDALEIAQVAADMYPTNNREDTE